MAGVENGVGIDLKQVKTFRAGKTKFNELYDGTIIVGTEEAIKAEMAEVWQRIKGPEGERMREKMRGIRALLVKSWQEGRSRQAMEGLSQYF